MQKVEKFRLLNDLSKEIFGVLWQQKEVVETDNEHEGVVRRRFYRE